jgi:hypothetical protein
MKKIHKPHYRWMSVKQDAKVMDDGSVLFALNVVREWCPYAFDRNSGMRISLLQKNGALISGYVIYDSDLGGYGIVSRVNCIRDETTVLPVDIHNIVAMEYSNHYDHDRNGRIQPIRLGDYGTNLFCPIIQDVVDDYEIYRHPVKDVFPEYLPNIEKVA